jgi:hypothetical protein
MDKNINARDTADPIVAVLYPSLVYVANPIVAPGPVSPWTLPSRTRARWSSRAYATMIPDGHIHYHRPPQGGYNHGHRGNQHYGHYGYNSGGNDYGYNPGPFW